MRSNALGREPDPTKGEGYPPQKKESPFQEKGLHLPLCQKKMSDHFRPMGTLENDDLEEEGRQEAACSVRVKKGRGKGRKGVSNRKKFCSSGGD